MCICSAHLRIVQKMPYIDLYFGAFYWKYCCVIICKKRCGYPQFSFWIPMGSLQLVVTWYKIRHAGEQAFSLFWMPQCVTCSPAWRILYHVIVSCKGPIALAKIYFSRIVINCTIHFGIRRHRL